MSDHLITDELQRKIEEMLEVHSKHERGLSVIRCHSFTNGAQAMAELLAPHIEVSRAVKRCLAGKTTREPVFTMACEALKAAGIGEEK